MDSVIVVGGGVIGCAVAERLARAGQRVTLLERDHLAARASGGAAGLLAPYSEAGADAGLASLAIRGLALFPDLVQRLRAETMIDPEYRVRESLRVATSDEEETAMLRASPHTGAVEMDGDDCRRLEPDLSPAIRRGVLFQEAQVTPVRLVHALARAAVGRGAVIREGLPVDGLLESGVRTPEGVLEADRVVLAAGPWTAGLAASLGSLVEVSPRRGQLVTLAPRDLRLARILIVGSSYAVPKLDGTLVVGSTEEWAGFDARPTVAGVARILGLATQWLPGLAGAALQGVWAGLRPVTPSGHPITGPLDGHPAIVVATGHHRNGILLAPITAEIVAAGIQGSWE